MSSGKAIYKVVDNKGCVLIPKELRGAAEINRGDIVKLGIDKGRVTVQKVDLIEIGDLSPQAVETYDSPPLGRWKRKPCFPLRQS